jgi:hypothetical protein
MGSPPTTDRTSPFIVWRSVSHVTQLFRTPFVGFDPSVDPSRAPELVVPLRRFTPLGARRHLLHTDGGMEFFRRVRQTERQVLRKARLLKIARQAWTVEEELFGLVLQGAHLPAQERLRRIVRFVEARDRSPLASSPMEEIRAYLHRSSLEDPEDILEELEDIIESAQRLRASIAGRLLDESLSLPDALLGTAGEVDAALSNYLELTVPVLEGIDRELDELLELYNDIEAELVPWPLADAIRFSTRIAQSVFFFLVRWLPFLSIDRWANAIWHRYGWTGEGEPGRSFLSPAERLEAIRRRLEGVRHDLPGVEMLRALAAEMEDASEALILIRRTLNPQEINVFISQKRSRPGQETFLCVLGRPGLDVERVWFQEILVRSILPQASIEQLLDSHSVFVDLTNPSNPRVYDELGDEYPDIGRGIRGLYPPRDDIVELRRHIHRRQQAWRNCYSRCHDHPFFSRFAQPLLCYYASVPETHSGVMVSGAVRGDNLLRSLTKWHDALLMKLGDVVVEIADPDLHFHYASEPEPEARESFEQIVADALSVYLISDLHIGDGSETDIFDARKADSLAALFQHVAERRSSLVVLGDGLDGLQRHSLQAIMEIRKPLLKLLRRIPQVTMIPGNHDYQLSAAEAQRTGRWMLSSGRQRAARIAAGLNAEQLRHTITALTGATIRELILDIDRGLALQHGHFNDQHNVGVLGRIIHSTVYTLVWRLGGRSAAERLEYYFSERLDQRLQTWWWPKAVRTFERFFDRNMLLMEALDYLRSHSPLHRAYRLRRATYTVGNGHTHLFELPGDTPPIQVAMQSFCDALMLTPPLIQKLDTGTWAGRRFKFNMRGEPLKEDLFFSSETRDVIRILLTRAERVAPEEWEADPDDSAPADPQ